MLAQGAGSAVNKYYTKKLKVHFFYPTFLLENFFNYYRCYSRVLPNFIFKPTGNIFPTVVMKPPKLITEDSWIIFLLIFILLRPYTICM